MASPRTMFDPHVTRRAHRRVDTELSVAVISSSLGATRISNGRSCDVSEGGMSIVTAATLQAAQNVSVEIKLPKDQPPLKLDAVVRHQRHHLYGLEFVRASASQTSKIREVLD
jgi:c-di-GMP-binding flagellar brake protein YcgR